MQKCFGLVGCICQYRYVIGVVGVGDCCCGVSSASFLRQFEAILFARTYIQQLCEDTGCCPEDLPRAMNDREEWRERVRDIRAASTI